MIIEVDTKWIKPKETMKTLSFKVTRAEARKTLLEWVHQRFSLSWKVARQWIKDGNLKLDDKVCSDPRQRLERGQKIEASVVESKKKSEEKPKRARSPRPVIRFIDESIVIVEKPAGLTTVRHPEELKEHGERAKEFLPSTLMDLLPSVLGSSNELDLRAVHRLDKDTTGFIVFALTEQADQSLHAQFRAHTVERKYQALVRGQARSGRIESYLVRDRGDGRRGSGDRNKGQRAVTHVRVIEELGDFTLIECRLETGRTHQIRIHLGEAGNPLCGERLYDRCTHGKPLADGSGIGRIALHAMTLGFDHPSSGERVFWTSSLRNDMQVTLDRLRQFIGESEGGA